jgi:hypothetical protein
MGFDAAVFLAGLFDGGLGAAPGSQRQGAGTRGGATCPSGKGPRGNIVGPRARAPWGRRLASGLGPAGRALRALRRADVLVEPTRREAVRDLRPAHNIDSASGAGDGNPTSARQGRPARRGGNAGRPEKAD